MARKTVERAIPPSIGTLQRKDNALGPGVYAAGAVGRGELASFGRTSRRGGREIDANEVLKAPRKVTARPSQTRAELIARKHTEFCTTAPLGPNGDIALLGVLSG